MDPHHTTSGQMSANSNVDLFLLGSGIYSSCQTGRRGGPLNLLLVLATNVRRGIGWEWTESACGLDHRKEQVIGLERWRLGASLS
jgi:hypothetical protein